MPPTNLNLNHFKVVKDMKLKLLDRGPLEWQYLRAKFHENLSSGSKVISEGHTDRETDCWFDKPTFIFGK
jgi:hypothetical protein